MSCLLLSIAKVSHDKCVWLFIIEYSFLRYESGVWQRNKESRIDSGAIAEIRSSHSVYGMSLKDRSRNSDVRLRCGLKYVVTSLEKVFHGFDGDSSLEREAPTRDRPDFVVYGAVHLNMRRVILVLLINDELLQVCRLRSALAGSAKLEKLSGVQQYRFPVSDFTHVLPIATLTSPFAFCFPG
ncbi:hypothetical protein EVAR_22452_1 [Eumeta japonica]|uniref:Uncharacterized protein n=1 Tax=Eumeta variegata TaxID=151549 RepID=A0A4C1VCR3_EUMVA|nr:hypothetical protein EVAR_22452_1 [Eumeta japonica]